MKNLLDKFIIKRRCLVFDESDMSRVLNVVGSYRKMGSILTLANCGWNDKTKWFVRFATSNTDWENVIKDLRVIRVCHINNIPEGITGIVYSTD